MRIWKFFLVLLFLAVPALTFAEQAKTVDELTAMYDVNSCKECHSQIYDEWSKSIHARSLIGTGSTMGAMKGMIDPALMKTFTKSGVKEIKDIKVEHFAYCFKCHLPQIKDATDEVAQQLAKAILDGDKATLEKVNINCLVCHNLKAIVHKWQDGEPEKGVVYGSKDGSHADKVYKAMKKSVILEEVVMCGQCHGLGPNFEFPQPSQCATLYGSYLHAYIPADGDETCQDCHMEKSGKGHTMPAYRDPDMVKMAVNVDIHAKGYKVLPRPGDLIPMAAVTVKIANKAGHRIPDG
ncbi:MAG: cytochrome C [Nitrospirae bacterium]|nr:cytochrome C [Nitrospirota bacterium]